MLLTFALCVVGVKLDVMLQAARAARRSRTRHPVCCKLCDTFDVTNYTLLFTTKPNSTHSLRLLSASGGDQLADYRLRNLVGLKSGQAVALKPTEFRGKTASTYGKTTALVLL